MFGSLRRFRSKEKNGRNEPEKCFSDFPFPHPANPCERHSHVDAASTERNVEIGLQIGNLFVMPYIPV